VNYAVILILSSKHNWLEAQSWFGNLKKH